MSASLDAARRYVAEGLSVIPIPHGQKAPILPGWQLLRLTANDLSAHFNDGQNIGVLLGEPSRWRVDVDLDSREAVALAPALLPRSNAIFGRAGKPRSHWSYVASGAKTEHFKDPDGTMLVELRSTGAQTVFPGSVHSGERIEWSEEGIPASIEAAELRRAVAKLAAASLLARHWPSQGSRDETAMALAGALLRAAWSPEETDHFIVAVAGAGGDDEAPSRAKAQATATKLASGDGVTGWPRLRELLGKDVAERARQWLASELHAEAPRTWTVSDLITASREQPADPLIDSLLARGDRFLIFAFAGVGKSLVGLHLAFALHRGQPFLGHFATTKARVGYVDEESAPPRLGERLALIATGQGINVERDDLPLFRVLSGERLDRPEGVARIATWVREHRLDVLVLDTLRRVHRLRENEADDMAQIELAMKELQRLSRDVLGHPLTIVLLHHSPKPRAGGAETMARGSSDIIGAMDGALYLKAKGSENIEIEHAKARWTAQLDPFAVTINSAGPGLRLEYAGATPTKQSRGSEVRDVIVRILTSEGGPLSRGDIVERAARAGVKRRQTVQAELKSMVEDARLIKQEAGRVTLYRLVDASEESRF